MSTEHANTEHINPLSNGAGNQSLVRLNPNCTMVQLEQWLRAPLPNGVDLRQNVSDWLRDKPGQCALVGPWELRLSLDRGTPSPPGMNGDAEVWAVRQPLAVPALLLKLQRAVALLVPHISIAPNKQGWALAVLGLLLAAFMVVTANSHGPDLNWDFLNYHWYNGFAWWHQRYDVDFLPAQLQSFFNPLFDIVFYALVQHTSPRTASQLLALVQGLNLVLVFMLARNLLARPELTKPILLPTLIALIAATGATFRSQVGSTMGDTVVSLPILVALWGLMCWPQLRGNDGSALRMSALLGACAGLAAGIKMTMILPVIALGVGLAVLRMDRPGRAVAQFICFGLGAIAVWLLCSGWWLWLLYSEWQNPIFPFMNQYFQSPKAAPMPHTDLRFVAGGLLPALSFPWRWQINTGLVSELPFFDLRLSLAMVSAAALLLLWSRLTAPIRGLLSFVWLSYLSWALMFGIYRYLAVLELLAPLLLVLLIPTALLRRWLGMLAMGFLVVLGLNTEPPDWGRDRSFGDRWFSISWPKRMPSAQDLVLIAGDSPLGFLVAEMPGLPAAVRIQGNIFSFQRDDRLLRQALDHARTVTGAPWLLFDRSESARVRDLTETLGLQWNDSECGSVLTPERGNVPRQVVLCPVTKAATSSL